MTDDVKERFKVRVREIAAHLCSDFHTIDSAARDDLRARTERAIFAGVQLARPPNAFALSSALHGCVNYIAKADEHGALDNSKLRPIGLLPPAMMIERWLEPLDKLFLANEATVTAVEESSLPQKEAPPDQASEK